MKPLARHLWVALLALLLSASVIHSTYAQDTASGRPAFTQAELDRMLAPIALYPDPLLSQILMAATYPVEVVQAARWSKANPGLKGDEAVRAVQDKDWDLSVKSLTAFPNLLAMMDENLEWTEQLGEAFLAQEPHVMETVQMLRQRAQAAGNLRSNDYITVQEQGSVILLEPPHPRAVYVPYYDPLVVYGPWWHPAHPPVYWRPWPGYYSRSGITFGIHWGPAIAVSTGFFFGRVDWPRRHVHVVHVNDYYRPRHAHVVERNVVIHHTARSWVHEPQHRRGAPYRTEAVRQRFSHPSQPRVESRPAHESSRVIDLRSRPEHARPTVPLREVRPAITTVQPTLPSSVQLREREREASQPPGHARRDRSEWREQSTQRPAQAHTRVEQGRHEGRSAHLQSSPKAITHVAEPRAQQAREHVNRGRDDDRGRGRKDDRGRGRGDDRGQHRGHSITR